MSEWIKAGSLRLSKSKKAVVIVVNKRRFIANANDVSSVLSGKMEWCQISQPSE
jgi:hypothetical protein